MELAVLLRNCPHDSTPTGDFVGGVRYERYALKCDSFSIQIAKTPIQVPIPQDAPEIIDIGFYRPSISIGGIIDTLGEDTTTVGPWSSGGDAHYYFRNMGTMSVTRKHWKIDGLDGGNDSLYENPGDYVDVAATYYIPSKNILEEIVYKWITTADDALELEIGDANFPVYNRAMEPMPPNPPAAATTPNLASGTNNETGGGIYVVAVQQARFQVDPAQEDRWQFQMQFVCESRKDVKF